MQTEDNMMNTRPKGMTEFAPGLGARTAANRALADCLRRRRPLDVALNEAVTSLAARDGGFARAIANETMRRFGQLDDLLRCFVPRPPLPHKAGPTLEILLAGICELLFLHIPAHAAVDGANRLAAADPRAVHFRPLINAALRRIAREGVDILRQQDEVRLNTPDWLWTRWVDAFGEDVTRAVAKTHARTPPLDISLKPGSENFLRENANELPGGVIRLKDSRDIEGLPGFAEGEFWVQDFAASLPARLLGDIAGRDVIDLCAAPGGKTAQLCSKGAHVTAVECDERRMARLTENLARLRFNAKLVLRDVRDYQPPARAACVLLDAPCSATGTIRRHPELPWIKSAQDIVACAGATAELLESAASMVRPEGLLVFAVCSLEPEEGSEQIAHFLRNHDEFRRMPISPNELFGLTECIDMYGNLRTLPCHFAESGGMDGFYATRLVRL
jgi:16S rRNA (cytosine967-C5)-methyltransferase